MTLVSDVYDYLCKMAPLQLQMSFDNSGFLLGRKEREVKKVLLALDVTNDVVEEAISIAADLIISHHPLIFSAIKSVTDDKLLRLLENNIAVISMHTNLDIAPGGVNDVLLALLGAECSDVLDEDGCGRIGYFDEKQDFNSFVSRCKSVLNCNGIRYYYSGKPVKYLAVMGGAGADAIELAFEKGCDTYVTADIKYHQFLRAAEIGINLIDADHFSTENPIIIVLCERLRKTFPEVEFTVSAKHRAIIEFA